MPLGEKLVIAKKLIRCDDRVAIPNDKLLAAICEAVAYKEGASPDSLPLLRLNVRSSVFGDGPVDVRFTHVGTWPLGGATALLGAIHEAYPSLDTERFLALYSRMEVVLVVPSVTSAETPCDLWVLHYH